MGKSHKHLNEPPLVQLQELLKESGYPSTRMSGYVRILTIKNKIDHGKLIPYLRALMSINAIDSFENFGQVVWVYPKT